MYAIRSTRRHTARIYELGPEPGPDDIDGRTPAVVTWHDADLFFLVGPQEAWRQSHRQAAFAQIEFATDSPLEGDGFELPVREHEQLWDSETAMRINLVSSVLRLS